jgi:hypothetical protein
MKKLLSGNEMPMDASNMPKPTLLSMDDSAVRDSHIAD